MARRRCNSWAPTKPSSNTSAAPAFEQPSRRSSQWKPCRNTLDDDDVAGRCGDCWERLVDHPDPAVKMSLLAEDHVPSWAIELLAADGNPLVSMLAEQRRAAPASH